MKDKAISPSRQVAGKTILAAFQILKEAGGSMRIAEIIGKIPGRVNFSSYELERYEKTGNVRWKAIFHLYSIDCIKAGFLQKQKGVWTLTPDGEAAMNDGANTLIDQASKAYRKWKHNQPSAPLLTPPAGQGTIGETDQSEEKEQQALLDQFEEKAFEGIRDFMLRKTPYEFQDMAAALLEVMGYHIAHISPKGPDGGIDIIAYNDPLGTKPPRIIVQVKHRPASSVPSDDIQRLLGTMQRESDVGLFVTSGDFSNPARLAARQSNKHVELIDFTRFTELWIANYDRMKDEQKNMLPLHPIYFLGTNES